MHTVPTGSHFAVHFCGYVTASLSMQHYFIATMEMTDHEAILVDLFCGNLENFLMLCDFQRNDFR